MSRAAVKSKMLLTVWLLGIWSGYAVGEPLPLYRQMVEEAVVNQQDLAHSKKKLDEFNSVEIKEKFVIKPFHKQSGELETAPNTFCRTCHGPLPHSKQLRTRTFNNMHVRFIACETCHFRPEGIEFSYVWYDFIEKEQAQADNLFRLDQEKDNSEQRPANPKIAPFFQGSPAFVTKDSAFSEAIAGQWKDVEGDDKVQLRAKVHKPLKKKGAACKACHDEDERLLDLTALGATDEQIQAIAKHVIPQFFRRYKKDDEYITIQDLLR